jgi:hypothetical protein
MNHQSFWLHDYRHDETLGPFSSQEGAVAEAVRVAAIPWDEPPNLAPCVNWETCGREYAVVDHPGSEMDAPVLLEIDRDGVRWLIDPSSDIAQR